MCDPNPITSALLLPLALFAYIARNPEMLMPFEQQWYRGCGWFPSDVRGLEDSK